MTAPGGRESPAVRVLTALVEASERDPRYAVLNLLPASEGPDDPLGGIVRPRARSAEGPLGPALAHFVKSVPVGSRPVAVGSAAALVGEAYAWVRDAVGREALDLDLVGLGAGIPPPSGPYGPAVLDDVGLVRAIPGSSVFAPADASSAQRALAVALEHRGLVYLRLPSGAWPEVTTGDFAPGRASVLRDGSDLCIAAYGPLVGQALEVAQKLRAVGVGARVLDCASIKPLDEKALVRAARETGAILTLEDHTPFTGLGAAVAVLIGPEVPVPLRTLGVPDLFVSTTAAGAAWEAVGLGVEAVVDEAWELLRQRGKVQ